MPRAKLAVVTEMDRRRGGLDGTWPTVVNVVAKRVSWHSPLPDARRDTTDLDEGELK